MTDPFRDSQVLMAVYGQTVDQLNPTQAKLYRKLMAEEYNEFIFAETEEDLVKEAIDLMVTVLGYLHSRGIDSAEAWAEVHRSNLSKLDADGQPTYRDDGKICKGEFYRAPDIKGIIKMRDGL